MVKEWRVKAGGKHKAVHFRKLGLGFRVRGLGFSVWGLGFGV